MSVHCLGFPEFINGNYVEVKYLIYAKIFLGNI